MITLLQYSKFSPWELINLLSDDSEERSEDKLCVDFN